MGMGKVYKSIVAQWYLYTCFAMAIAFVGSIYLCYKTIWVLLIDVIFMGFGVLLMFDILYHTDYTINGDKLYIRCGVFYRMTLPISKITEITHKTTFLSSPALSAKRIGLRYGNKSYVYISPQNQDDFISELKSINPGIIELKE